MKISLLEFDPKSISLSVERDHKRSDGIHLSSIIKDRLITAGIERKVKGGVKFTENELHLLFERGFLWERMGAEYLQTEEWHRKQLDQSAGQHFTKGVLETLSSNIVRPGECCLDSIYMTPDALDMTNVRIVEWKATGLRCAGFSLESRRPEWLWQACSYANVFGMTKALFHIWHVSDCKISPILVEWSEEEVKESWRQILEHYRYMKERKDKECQS